jgi:hypothetical protein
MDSIEEIILASAALVIFALIVVFILPGITNFASQLNGQSASQIIQNSFKLESSSIVGSNFNAVIYDNGYPTTLYVKITAFNASNNQPYTTTGKTISFKSGANNIALPSFGFNVYYEIDLYSSQGGVLYKTMFVNSYQTNYIKIENVFNYTKVYINGILINYTIQNNSAIIPLPNGAYNVAVYTPYAFYTTVVSVPSSTPPIIIPTNAGTVNIQVKQLLPGGTLNILSGAVISINNNTAIYRTNSTGYASIKYNSTFNSGIVSITVSCPPSTCGSQITNNYTTYTNSSHNITYYASNPIVLRPKFRLTTHLRVVCGANKTTTAGAISFIASPANSTLNSYGKVNSSGIFITYLQSGFYNIFAATLNRQFNSTNVTITSQNQTKNVTFFCSAAGPIPTNVTIFSETGLPLNSLWNVTYASIYNSSTTSKIKFKVVNLTQSYSYTIPSQTISGWNYIPAPSSGNTKAGTQVNVTFKEQTYKVKFVETGLPTGTKWNVTYNCGTHCLPGTLNSSTTNTVLFQNPNSTASYTYTIPNQTLSCGSVAHPTPSSGTASNSTSPVSVSFSGKCYNTTFTESGLPTGTKWNVTYNSKLESSTTTQIVFSVPTNSSYAYTIPSQGAYSPSPSSGSTNGGTTVAVTFSNLPAPCTATGVLHCVKIVLTNSQSSATVTNFQQQLNINWNTYSSELASNVQNVNFTDSAGNKLYATCETNCSNTATNSLVWVNMSSDTIAATGGTQTIYLRIYSTTTNNYNSAGSWGAYPTFTATYGQYTNWNKVFPYYQPFGGLSALPSGWTNDNSQTIKFAATYTNLTTSNVGEWEGISISSTPSVFTTLPTVIDLYGNLYSTASYLPSSWFGLVDSCGRGPGNAGFGETTTSPNLGVITGCTSTLTNTATTDTNGNKAYSLEIINSSSETVMIGYTAIATKVAISIPNDAQSFGIWKATLADGVSTFSQYIYWVRVRAYPPNGVMPSVAFTTIN